MSDWRQGGFGLYVHWPFCAAKCPYCDFNSHVASTIDHARWRQAYLAEIDRIGAETRGRVLNTVFFGGGTPSLMDPETVAQVIERIRATWPTANDLEITLEANPTSVESGRFRAFSEAGVTRLSMGMQAMDDESLKRLGRMHSAAEGRAAFDIARAHFDRVSFDLIYARQGQSLEAWARELNEALSMAVDHFSLYQLTIEDGTAFGRLFAAGKLRELPEDELAADMYLRTQEICEAARLPAYEVSNHARPGAECRHNLVYWRYGDYAGIGPGAHGRLSFNGTRYATEAPKAPGEWLACVEREGNGETPRETLSRDEEATEFLLFGLRLAEGIDPTRYEQLSGQSLPEQALNNLESWGMIARDAHRIRATGEGRAVLNAVIRELMP
ncbi:oxygen-independent coproporphyrinogen-3 oxidase [Rhodobacter aestuarii]|uniref:Heme chaperone HemW n=1 Tax=Rhodobacter aestuarii TaxID=453582 RepID=A0A1N7LKE1_9RHOB|nr:radical SAM family heme chaperone HemW [Rhodobacter aestuarii]PTV95199.1 oxygen-independent coproporphyrinogen-3 oxidase [Rhodobacter aestuarii]SIS74286.1 oxygen-independent coproporphyrinogen-3 oxidase [Rhodobacter aestuarii]